MKMLIKMKTIYSTFNGNFITEDYKNYLAEVN